MRFKTKFGRGLKPAFLIGAVFLCVGLLFYVLNPYHRTDRTVFSLWPLAYLLIIPWAWPQYYDVREDGLFLRQGFSKNLIPYKSLVVLRSIQANSRNYRVFSGDRLLVVTETGQRFVIAVAEQERFLAEVSKRCPQLELKNSSLEIPFAPMLIV